MIVSAIHHDVYIDYIVPIQTFVNKNNVLSVQKSVGAVIPCSLLLVIVVTLSLLVLLDGDSSLIIQYAANMCYDSF